MKDLLHNIRFKQIPIDKDEIYSKVISRIGNDLTENTYDKSSWTKRFVLRYRNLVAAVLFLVLITSITYYINKTSIENIYVESVSGMKTKVLLSDGSIIWLNGNSKLSYPQKFVGDKREIVFSGEGIFEIAKDVDKPFIVNIDSFKVEVLGTVFNINTKCEDIIETTLIEGSVAFYTNDAEIPRVVMKPNEQTIYNKKTNKLRVKGVNAKNYMSWVDNNFNFEDESIFSVVNQLERGFGVKINIKGNRLNCVKITGVFNNDETIDEILSILGISVGFKCSKAPDGEYYIE